MSTALNGTLFALRMVSSREVAVTMCDEPAVRDVKIQSAGSVEKVVPEEDMVFFFFFPFFFFFFLFPRTGTVGLVGG